MNQKKQEWFLIFLLWIFNPIVVYIIYLFTDWLRNL